MWLLATSAAISWSSQTDALGSWSSLNSAGAKTCLCHLFWRRLTFCDYFSSQQPLLIGQTPYSWPWWPGHWRWLAHYALLAKAETKRSSFQQSFRSVWHFWRGKSHYWCLHCYLTLILWIRQSESFGQYVQNLSGLISTLKWLGFSRSYSVDQHWLL